MRWWAHGDGEQLRALLEIICAPERAEKITEEMSVRFGSLSVLLEAARCDKDVVGLSESAQLLLTLVPELSRRRRLERFGERPLLDTRSRAGEFARVLYTGARSEMLLLLCLDEEMRLVQYRMMEEGSLTEVQFRPRAVAQEVLRSGAPAVILCHNHPSGWLHFSETDVSATEKLRSRFGLLGLSLVDHLLIAGDGVIGMRGQSFIDERLWRKQAKLSPPLAEWARQGTGGLG